MDRPHARHGVQHLQVRARVERERRHAVPRPHAQHRGTAERSHRHGGGRSRTSFQLRTSVLPSESRETTGVEPCQRAALSRRAGTRRGVRWGPPVGMWWRLKCRQRSRRHVEERAAALATDVEAELLFRTSALFPGEISF